MPPRPEEALSADEKALFRRWIEQGAKNLPSAAVVSQSRAWTLTTGHSGRRQTRRLRQCAIQARVRTAIDRFIQKALEEQGIDPRS